MADQAVEPPAESSPRPPADSMEIDEEVKEEESVDGPSGGLSRELCKEMRAICDTLSTHRITIKGDG